MERHSFAMEIKKGKKNEYRQILGEIWPDLTAFLDQEKVHNFSIWNCDSLIFGYYETDENNEFSEEKKASIQALTSRIDHTFTWTLHPGENMRLMYHNFGVVSRDSELNPPQNVHNQTETSVARKNIRTKTRRTG
ncbi:MAG: L-rhamnose mutarotase [Blautia faecis]